MINEDYLTKDYKMKLCIYIILLLISTPYVYSQKIMKEIIKTEKAPLPVGPYSQAVLVNNILYVSGQVGINIDNNKLITESIEAETKQVMDNIEAVLKEANFNFENVVKSTIFITDMKNFSKVNKVYGSYFKEEFAPARETVEVSALPIGARIEISVTAIKTN